MMMTDDELFNLPDELNDEELAAILAEEEEAAILAEEEAEIEYRRSRYESVRPDEGEDDEEDDDWDLDWDDDEYDDWDGEAY